MIAVPRPDAVRRKKTRRTRPGRSAMTLVEVLTALAIFLMAMVVFGGIIVKNGEVARTIQRQNMATRLCQSMLAQVAAGVVPLSSQGDVAFDDDPNYTWSLDAEQGAEDGLWNVTVTVKGPAGDDGQPIQCQLMKMILDPSLTGSTQDVTQPTSSTTSSSSSSSSSATPQSPGGK